MSDPEQDLRLHLTVGDVSIKVEGEPEKAELKFEALRQEFIDTPAPVQAGDDDGSSHTTTSGSTANGGKQISLSELYQSSDDMTKRDRILLIGHYKEKYENQDDFTRQEIEDAAQDSKIQLGANVSRDFRLQIEDGYLTQVGERDGDKAYYLTRTGEDYVSNELLSDE